jgi:serine/threonine protein kinase
MTTLLRCVNGHEYDAGSASGSKSSSCPICGAVERTMLTPPSLPAARPPLAAVDTLAHPLPENPPVLAGYEVLEEIGRGGMGIVYRARQLVGEQPGRIVALKVIRKERLGNADMLSRFRREAQASSRLAHPNVVEVYDSHLEGDTHYLAMEYVPGITLQKLVEQTGPLPLGQACDFIRQAALGLAHAAEQRLVHRDVKPANLMVVAPSCVSHAARTEGSSACRTPPRPEGFEDSALRAAASDDSVFKAAACSGLPLPPRPVVKVLDLGVARLHQLTEQEVSLTTLTRDGSVIGTPDYIAPEQLEDPRGVDIRADLYSLGCTFYFLLTGQVPFPGGTLVQKLDRQRWQTAPGVNQLRPEIPAALAAVVRKLMAKHPDDRYQTPAELAAVLDTLLRTGDLPGSYQPAPIREVRKLIGHTSTVTSVAFCEGGRLVVSGGADHTLRLWEASSGVEKMRLGDSRHEIGCVAVIPGSGIILAGQGVTVRGWDPTTGREVFKLSGHNDAVRSLAVSGDGKRAISGGDDRTIRVWDLERGREIQRFTRHRAGVTGVALSPDGKLALSGARDQTLRLWETANAKEVRSFNVPRGPVLCVALTPDGNSACSGHFDTTLRLWDVRTGRELRRFSGHKQMVVGLACLADGRLLSASHDQTVRLWDSASGTELGSAQGHTAPVTAVTVAPDQQMLASASVDQTVRLWQDVIGSR